MSDDKRKAYEELCSEYRFSIKNQLEAHNRIRQRNTDLAKINLLGIGALLAGISISDLQVTILFFALIASFSASLLYSARILRHRPLKRGLSPGVHSFQEDLEDDDKDLWEIYRKFGKSHAGMVSDIAEEFDDIEYLYQRALWCSITSFVFLIVYVILFSIDVEYPMELEIALLFFIPILVIAARDIIDESK